MDDLEKERQRLEEIRDELNKQVGTKMKHVVQLRMEESQEFIQMMKNILADKERALERLETQITSTKAEADEAAEAVKLLEREVKKAERDKQEKLRKSVSFAIPKKQTRGALRSSSSAKTVIVRKSESWQQLDAGTVPVQSSSSREELRRLDVHQAMTQASPFLTQQDGPIAEEPVPAPTRSPRRHKRDFIPRPPAVEQTQPNSARASRIARAKRRLKA